MDRHDDPQPTTAASDAEPSSRAVDAGAAAPGVARVVVWDVPAAIERGERFTVRIGVTGSSARPPDGGRVEVRDHEGGSRAAAALDGDPWPGTDALYHTEVALVAPEAEGLYTWEAVAVSVEGPEPRVAPETGAAEPGGVVEAGGASDSYGVAEAGGVSETGGAAEPGGVAEAGGASDSGAAPEPGAAPETVGAAEPGAGTHTGGRARFGVRVVPAPECRVTVVALDAESRIPVEGARVVAHPYRAVTDERGMAELQIPAGEYRLFVSGRGCIPFRFDGAVTADTTIRAELEQDRELSDADIWS